MTTIEATGNRLNAQHFLESQPGHALDVEPAVAADGVDSLAAELGCLLAQDDDGGTLWHGGSLRGSLSGARAGRHRVRLAGLGVVKLGAR